MAIEAYTGENASIHISNSVYFDRNQQLNPIHCALPPDTYTSSLSLSFVGSFVHRFCLCSSRAMMKLKAILELGKLWTCMDGVGITLAIENKLTFALAHFSPSLYFSIVENDFV